MPLRITDLNTPGQVGVLNKWASWIETQLKATNTKIFSVANTAVDNIPPVTPGVTDGLIHGDDIWAIDPAYVLLREDFNDPSTNTFGPMTGGNGLNWYGINGSSGNFTSAFNAGGPFPMQGVAFMVNNTTATNANFLLTPSPSTVQGDGTAASPLLDYPGWKMVWVFGIDRSGQAVSTLPAFSWAQVSFYMGLANYESALPIVSSSSRPPHFLGLRYDTSTAGGPGDTQFVFEYVNNLTSTPNTRINTQGTTFSTGMTATEGRVYRFEMSCLTSGQIKFLLTDGVTTVTNTMSISVFSASGLTLSNVTGSNGFWSADPPTNFWPVANGSKFTIASGSVAAANGNWTSGPKSTYPSTVGSLLNWKNSGTQGVTSSTGVTLSMFPALQPFVAFGNDNQATPSGGSKGVMVDFIALIWNKGLALGAPAPNSTLARYW